MQERGCILDIRSMRTEENTKTAELSYRGKDYQLTFIRIPGTEPSYGWILRDAEVASMLGGEYVMGIGAFFARLLVAAERVGLPVCGLDISHVFRLLTDGRDIGSAVDRLLEKRQPE